MLGMPLGTVKGRMRLGLEKIRATLAEGIPRGGRPGGATCERAGCQPRAGALPRRPRRLRARGALRRAAADELRRHLDGCEDCRDAAAVAAPAVDLLPARGRPASSRQPSSASGLMATVRARVARRAAGAELARPARWRELGRLSGRPAIGGAPREPCSSAGALGGYLLHQPTETRRSRSPVQADEVARRTVSGTLERQRRLGDPPRAGDAGAGARPGLRDLGAARRRDGAHRAFRRCAATAAPTRRSRPARRRPGRASHPRAARRQPRSRPRAGAPGSHCSLGAVRAPRAPPIVLRRWRPATATRTARRTSPAPTAGGRSARTA